MIEDVPRRRFVNDPTFMVALGFPWKRSSAPRAVEMSQHSVERTSFVPEDCTQPRFMFPRQL